MVRMIWPPISNDGWQPRTDSLNCWRSTYGRRWVTKLATDNCSRSSRDRCGATSVISFCICGLESIAGHYEDEAAAEFLVRIGQYLIERDYFAPADIPQWLRVAERMHKSDFQPLLNLLQRTVARKIGVPHDQPVPNCISRLLDEEHLRAAFPKFIAQTPEYQQLIAQSGTARQPIGADKA